MDWVCIIGEYYWGGGDTRMINEYFAIVLPVYIAVRNSHIVL